MQGPPLLRVTLVSLGVGVALMIPSESTLARIVGVGALFAFVVCGVFLIANPTDLGRSEDEGA